jgi:cytochrome b6-f complex iron-sulfur subunit
MMADEKTTNEGSETPAPPGGTVPRSAAATITPPTPATPVPPRPAPAAAVKSPPAGKMDRRVFLSSLSIGWITFTAALAATTAGMVRFLFPNVLYEPPQEFKAGLPADYNMGVDERWKQQYQVWIVREEGGMYALLAVCTHLGCLPTWLPNEAKFKCPCHGSGFYMSGINFEGPAPRPLERVRIVRAEDGQILVDKSKKYQYEKGQWSDPESYLKLT